MRLRRAEIADIDAIMEIERLPGYEAFVGRSARAEHEDMMSSPRFGYFVGEDVDGVTSAFALLRELENAHGNVYLQRIAVRNPGQGEGERFLAALLDWIFAQPLPHRVHLDCFDTNARAQKLYARAGFTRDGVLREAYLDHEGKRRTLALMALLKPEWRARRGPPQSPV